MAHDVRERGLGEGHGRQTRRRSSLRLLGCVQGVFANRVCRTSISQACDPPWLTLCHAVPRSQMKGADIKQMLDKFQEAIAEQQTFKIKVTSKMADSIGASLMLQFRSANNGNLDGSMPLIGIPSTVQSSISSTANVQGGPTYYYASVVREGSSGERPSSGTSSIASSSSRLFTVVNEKVDPFEDVRLGALLGCGAFGRVYR